MKLNLNPRRKKRSSPKKKRLNLWRIFPTRLHQFSKRKNKKKMKINREHLRDRGFEGLLLPSVILSLGLLYSFLRCHPNFELTNLLSFLFPFFSFILLSSFRSQRRTVAVEMSPLFSRATI